MARLQLRGYRGASHRASGLCTPEATRQQFAKIKPYLHAWPPARPPTCTGVLQRPLSEPKAISCNMQNARQATHRLQDRYMHSLAIESIPKRP